MAMGIRVAGDEEGERDEATTMPATTMATMMVAMTAVVYFIGPSRCGRRSDDGLEHERGRKKTKGRAPGVVLLYGSDNYLC